MRYPVMSTKQFTPIFPPKLSISTAVSDEVGHLGHRAVHAEMEAWR